MPEGDYFGFNIKREKGTVEMKYSDSCSYLKVIGANKVLFKMIFNADPQLGLIPQWFMDWLVRSITGVALGSIQTSSKTLDDVFWNRYLERKDFYDAIEFRIKPILDLEKKYI